MVRKTEERFSIVSFGYGRFEFLSFPSEQNIKHGRVVFDHLTKTFFWHPKGARTLKFMESRGYKPGDMEYYFTPYNMGGTHLAQIMDTDKHPCQ